MVDRGVFATAALVLAAAMVTVSGPAVAAPASVTTGVGPVAPAPIVVPNAPAPDPVPVTCAWLVKGFVSNCDGLDPNRLYTSGAWPTACTGNNDLLLHTVSSATMPGGALIQVTYAGGSHAGCRTVAASLYVPKYSGSGACSLTLTRSSDKAVAMSRISHAGGFWSAETPSLYDAGVSSYASATCTYGGHTYTARTTAY